LPSEPTARFPVGFDGLSGRGGFECQQISKARTLFVPNVEQVSKLIPYRVEINAVCGLID
jgi:hypothetical protein